MTTPPARVLPAGLDERPASPVSPAVLVLRQILAAIEDQGETLAALVTAIETLVARQAPPPGDARHARLLVALAESMADLDLPFDAAEVLAHRRTSADLDDALTALGIDDTAALGALFRSLRDRDLDSLMLVRDARVWRLRRTCRT